MIFNFALLSILLLASASLAVPSSRLGDRLARRDNIRQSQPLSRVASSAPAIPPPLLPLPPPPPPPPVVGSPNWGGVVLSSTVETFSAVVGTFTVPTPTGKDGSAVIWVGIDGSITCQQALLQTGIKVTVTQNQVQYEAWYEWYPEPSTPFTDIDIRAGDVITATVAADNTTFGMAVLENHTTNQTVYQDLKSPNSYSSLCETSAEWIVEEYLDKGVIVPFANFSSVTFTDAYAFGPDGTKYTPSGSDTYIVDIVQNNTVLTIVAIDGDSITVDYIKGEF